MKVARRRIIAPEVVQTSAMDCGPAALKCLLEGHRVRVSYGRLREACQTDVDGTSIDTLEQVANDLGLDASQEVHPLDHAFHPAAGLLPGMAVVLLPGRLTHFVVLWRRHGRWIQVMDPAAGRQWIHERRLVQELYAHELVVPARAWREFAGSDAFAVPLESRLDALGISDGRHLVRRALEDPSWRTVAALDASARMVSAVVNAGGLARGCEAERALAAITGRAAGDLPLEAVPARFWTARATDPADCSGEESVVLRGGVFLACRGLRREPARAELPPELAAALRERAPRPMRLLTDQLRADGVTRPVVLAALVTLGGAATVLEALLFRVAFDINRFEVLGYRLGVVAALAAFVVALLCIDAGSALVANTVGRHLDLRLRAAFLAKIPLLGDRYFQSRPVSDMAERAHAAHEIRLVPAIALRVLGGTMQLCATAAGIAWLAPDSAALAFLAAACTVLVPLVGLPALTEREMRQRSHVAAVTTLHLDALRATVPLRAHGAARAMRVEHDRLLHRWRDAGRDVVRAAVAVRAVQTAVGYALAAWIFARSAPSLGDTGSALLLGYWLLTIPVLGHGVAVALQRWPSARNVMLRLVEPLGAPSEGDFLGGPAETAAATRAATPAGVSIRLEGVTVVAGGHDILADVSVDISPGEVVGVVGPSGAGKSTLVGVLLGLHRASQGRVFVDGVPLSADKVQAVRREAAWIDPAVQLWDGSLLDNVRYGSREDFAVADLLRDTALSDTVRQLPLGLMTGLGEGGALLSGGEGQRVRLARGWARGGTRLVLLDEPFRGVDRPLRRELLRGALRRWRGATFLCATHDLADTLEFDRILVIDGGRVVEDGAPAELARAGGRFARLLDAEEEARQQVWSPSIWRRVRVDGGTVREARDAREAAWVT